MGSVMAANSTVSVLTTSSNASVSGLSGRKASIVSFMERRSVWERDDASMRKPRRYMKPPPLGGPKRKRFQRHCRSFGWAYVVAVVVFLVVFLPILFLKIIPSIVQAIANQAVLSIQNGTIHAYSSTQLQISLNATLSLPSGGVAIALDPTTISLSDANGTNSRTPYASLVLSAMTIDGHNTPIAVDRQLANITDSAALVTFMNGFFSNATTHVLAHALTIARVGSLASTVAFSQIIPVNSLAGLMGFSLNDARLVPSQNLTSTTLLPFAGTATVPNASPLTLRLGNVTLNLNAGTASAALPIGLVYLQDLVLLPGVNTVPFFGKLDLGVFVTNLSGVLAAAALENAETSGGAVLKNGTLAVNLSGNSTTVEGAAIPYVEEVLAGQRLIAEIPLVVLLRDAANMTGDARAALADGVLGALNGTGDFAASTAAALMLESALSV